MTDDLNADGTPSLATDPRRCAAIPGTPAGAFNPALALDQAGEPLVLIAVPPTSDVPDSVGLQLHVVDRVISVQDLAEHLPEGTRSVSVFLVDHRAPDKDSPDLAFAFQAELEVRADCPFVPRPDLRAALTEDWDEQVGDLHYANTPEYATGHGVSAEWEVSGGACRQVRTAWIASAEVEKTQTAEVPGVELAIDALGALPDGAAAESALGSSGWWGPAMSFGRPVIVDRGIPTAVVSDRYRAGESVSDLARDYHCEELAIEEAIRCELPQAA